MILAFHFIHVTRFGRERKQQNLSFMNTSIKILIVLIALCFSNSISAQEIIIKGTINDATTHEPLAYANIGLLNTTSGTVSSPQGDFVLHLPQDITAQSIIRVSYLGYLTQDFTIEGFNQEEIVEINLQQDAYTLSVVEVRPRLVNSRTIGHQNMTTSRYTNFAIGNKVNQNLGAAIGRKFKLDKESNFIDSFGFYISQNNFEEVKFRVNIYALTNGKPDKVLNKKDIIISLKDKKTGWTEVSLAECGMIKETEIAVVIEWIYHSETGSRLALPISFPTMGTHFYKFGSQGKWKRFRGMSTAMYLKIGKVSNPNS